MRLLLATCLLLCTTPTLALDIFACEPEWGALARELAPQANITVATSAQQDPHHVEARPSLIAKLRRADLVVCTGAELEAAWLPALLVRSSNPALKGERLFFAADHVERVGMPAGAIDRSQGDVHASGNPHVHLDPRRMARIGEALADTLARIDADNAATYRQRAATLQERLARVAQRGREAAATLPSNKVVVFHDAWPYLNDWLGLAQTGTLEPVPGVPPSSRHLAELATAMRGNGSRLILHASYDDRRAVDWLAARSDACAVELPYSPGGAPGTDTLDGWYDALIQGLTRNCR